MTLHRRFSAFFIAYAVLVLALFAGAYYTLEKREALKLQEAQRAKALANLASVCRDITVTANPITAINYLRSLKEDPVIRVAACLDGSGVALAHSDPAQLGRRWDRTAPPGVQLAEAPRSAGGRSAGSAWLGFDSAVLAAQIQGKLVATLRQLLAVGGLTFLLAVLAGLPLTRNLSKPIAALAESARRIGEGGLDHRTGISERDDELGLLGREMNSMAAKLKDSDKRKAELISLVSHDLRSPLSGIIACIDYLRESKGSQAQERQDWALGTMQDACRQLNHMVENILGMDALESGRLELKMEPFPVAGVTAEVLRLFDFAAKEKGVKLKEALSPGLPLALGDADKIRQVLVNLVSNAIKFTEEGGTVSIEAEARSTGEIELRVRDTGRGIPAAELPKLFERFQRVEEGLGRFSKTQGSGLGLSICREIVSRHGGTIDIASAPGKGSTFRFTLPKAGRKNGHGD